MKTTKRLEKTRRRCWSPAEECACLKTDRKSKRQRLTAEVEETAGQGGVNSPVALKKSEFLSRDGRVVGGGRLVLFLGVKSEEDVGSES